DCSQQNLDNIFQSMTNHNMNIILHVVNGDQLLPLRGHDSSNVLLKLIVMFRINKVLPAFNGEHDLNVNLSVGVSHIRSSRSLVAEYVGPTGLGGVSLWFYKDAGPNGPR